MRNRGIGLVIILMLGLTAFGQENRYMIFFTNKEGSNFSIENPEQFLTPRSLDRRMKQDIEVDESDLPVNASYLAGVGEIGAEVYFSSKWMNAALVQMSEELIDQILELEYVSAVDYIAPGTKLKESEPAIAMPTSFFEPTSQNANSDLQLGMMNVDDMHSEGYRGEEMMIAVFDAGFRGANLFKPFESLFVEERLVGFRDFVYNSGNPFQYNDHGTAVLSCIASDFDGFKGTAYKAQFLLAVTEDARSEYRVEEYNWLIAAEYADSMGADIIHSSLGYSTFSNNAKEFNYTTDDLDGRTAIITQASNMASDKGILVVTSAGNEGNSDWTYITAPADGFQVLAVGAINSNYAKSSFSSVGPTVDGRIKPDVVSLGSGTTVMNGGGSITRSNGTSYAAPLVAGLAAGIWQANPNWSNDEVVSAIKYTASRSTNPDTVFGYGVPNFEAARNGAVLSLEKIVNEGINVFPNPFQDNKLFVDVSAIEIQEEIEIKMYDLQGSVLFSQTYRPTADLLTVTVDNLTPGVYFLKVDYESFSKTIKLIKN